MQLPAHCLFCKAKDPKGYCGRPQCPYLHRSQSMFRVARHLPADTGFSGSSPAPFIGRIGYPHVSVGFLTPVDPQDEVARYDAPRLWAAEGFSIPKIIDYRSSLLNTRFTADVRSRPRMLDLVREVGMASRPVDLDITLKQRPSFSFNVDMTMAPHGPNAALEDAQITSNPRVDPKVERVVSDTDWKAADAIGYLYGHDFDENVLSRLFSVGAVGVGAGRRLVPTRWSITAVDDTLGKQKIERLRACEHVEEHMAYFGSYMGNYYLVLLFPAPWSYELFEAYLPPGRDFFVSPPDFAADFEPYAGRKSYASNTVGGYYAARLPILDTLLKMERQASVLVLRFITDEYAVPLGVWVVREAVRKAVMSQPVVFSSRELLLRYARALLARRFRVPAEHFISKSILLRELSSQRTLASF